MCRCTVAASIVMASVLWAGHSGADEAKGPNRQAASPRHVLEVGMTGLFEKMTTSKGDRSGEVSSRSGGNAIGMAVTYRTPYFLSPFVDVSYYPLFESQRRVDLGSAGGSAVAIGALSAIGFMGGGALDLWRLRLRAGVGTYAVMVRSSVLGATIHATESDMGYLLSAGGFLVRASRIQVGLEARAVFIVEADTTAVGIGVTITGDALRW